MRIIQVSRGSMDATPARRSSKWHPCTGRQDIAGRYPLVPHAPWISSVHSAQRHVLWSAQVGSEHIDNERRSEEHTSELQSLMRISYAVFCLYKKTTLQLQLSATTIT